MKVDVIINDPLLTRMLQSNPKKGPNMTILLQKVYILSFRGVHPDYHQIMEVIGHN